MAKFNEEHSKSTVKPGVYTTEFWSSLIAALYFAGNSAGVWHYVPTTWSAGATAFIAAAYAFSRGQAKRS